jgi:hypothetical protein
MGILVFSLLVVKYEEGGIAITSYDPLLELAKFYSYESFN